MKLLLRAAHALVLLPALVLPATADDAGDIRARLEQWRDDFNASRAHKVCDLFSIEAVSNYGPWEGGRPRPPFMRVTPPCAADTPQMAGGTPALPGAASSARATKSAIITT